MTEATNKSSSPLRWQDAKSAASELTIDLPHPEPGTAVYILTAGTDPQLLTLLRAFVRAAERKGHKVKLL